MRRTATIAIVLLFVFASNVQAAKLVVMGVNLRGSAPAGQKVYTIGVDMEGVSGHVGIQLPDFFVGTGSGGSPKQGNFDGGGNANNRQTLQSIEDTSADPDTLQYDSWWYVSPTGLYVDADTSATITTDSIVGTHGYLWQPFVTGVTGGTGPAPQFGSGTTIGFIGLYGTLPTPAVDLAATPVIPLVQMRVSGSISLHFGIPPAVAFISLLIDTHGVDEYNYLGGPKFTDPNAILDFNTDTIHAIPEPSAIVLAMIAVVLLRARTLRYRRS